MASPPRRSAYYGTPPPPAAGRAYNRGDGRSDGHEGRPGVRGATVRGGVPPARRTGRRRGRGAAGADEVLRRPRQLLGAVGGLDVALSRADQRLHRRAAPAAEPDGGRARVVG